MLRLDVHAALSSKWPQIAIVHAIIATYERKRTRGSAWVYNETVSCENESKNTKKMKVEIARKWKGNYKEMSQWMHYDENKW